MKKSTSSGKDRQFGVTVLAGTERVFKEMLSNGRVMGNDLRSWREEYKKERRESCWQFMFTPEKRKKAVLGLATVQTFLP